MAWSSTQIAAADQAAYLASKPYFAASSALRRRNRAPVWSSSGLWSNSGTTGAGSNITSSSLPTSYLYNGNLYDYTHPSSAGNGLSTLYLLFDNIPGSDADQLVDTVFVDVLNGDAFANLSVFWEVADDEDFGVRWLRPITFAGWGGLTAKMIGGWLASPGEGSSPRRFQDLRYSRLVFTTTDVGGFTTVGGKMPHVSEVMLSRRRQLGHNPREPWDDEPRESFVEDFTAPSGAVGRDVRYLDRQSFPLKLRAASAADASLAGIDELAAVRGLFDDANGGTRSFLYVDEPTGGPSGHGKGHFVYIPQPRLFAASLGSLRVRDVDLPLVELPPFQATEVF